ncbi:hypothetical protein F5Y16DRAFT_388364 [Xylariaceae sp. FL0255]|nr:hypothetical protein F5Y16DRAFT_388364 [Xylariaceae sp. FL0255]
MITMSPTTSDFNARPKRRKKVEEDCLSTTLGQCDVVGAETKHGSVKLGDNINSVPFDRQQASNPWLWCETPQTCIHAFPLTNDIPPQICCCPKGGIRDIAPNFILSSDQDSQTQSYDGPHQNRSDTEMLLIDTTNDDVKYLDPRLHRHSSVCDTERITSSDLAWSAERNLNSAMGATKKQPIAGTPAIDESLDILPVESILSSTQYRQQRQEGAQTPISSYLILGPPETRLDIRKTTHSQPLINTSDFGERIGDEMSIALDFLGHEIGTSLDLGLWRPGVEHEPDSTHTLAKNLGCFPDFTPRDLATNSARKRTFSGDDVGEGDECTYATNSSRISQERRATTGFNFACPFHKRFPVEHQECGKYKLRRIKDVKQHIYRLHCKPELYCPRCFQTFKVIGERDQHVRSGTCTSKEVQKFDISDDQKKALKECGIRGTKKQDQWMELWNVVFPKADRPRSPFVDNGQEELMSNLRGYWNKNATNLVTKYINDLSLENSDLSRLLKIAPHIQHIVDNVLDHFGAVTSDQDFSTEPLDCHKAHLPLAIVASPRSENDTPSLQDVDQWFETDYLSSTPTTTSPGPLTPED